MVARRTHNRRNVNATSSADLSNPLRVFDGLLAPLKHFVSKAMADAANATWAQRRMRADFVSDDVDPGGIQEWLVWCFAVAQMITAVIMIVGWVLTLGIVGADAMISPSSQIHTIIPVAMQLLVGSISLWFYKGCAICFSDTEKLPPPQQQEYLLNDQYERAQRAQQQYGDADADDDDGGDNEDEEEEGNDDDDDGVDGGMGKKKASYRDAFLPDGTNEKKKKKRKKPRPPRQLYRRKDPHRFSELKLAVCVVLACLLAVSFAVGRSFRSSLLSLLTASIIALLGHGGSGATVLVAVCIIPSLLAVIVIHIFRFSLSSAAAAAAAQSPDAVSVVISMFPRFLDSVYGPDLVCSVASNIVELMCVTAMCSLSLQLAGGLGCSTRGACVATNVLPIFSLVRTSVLRSGMMRPANSHGNRFLALADSALQAQQEQQLAVSIISEQSDPFNFASPIELEKRASIAEIVDESNPSQEERPKQPQQQHQQQPQPAERARFVETARRMLRKNPDDTLETTEKVRNLLNTLTDIAGATAALSPPSVLARLNERARVLLERLNAAVVAVTSVDDAASAHQKRMMSEALAAEKRTLVRTTMDAERALFATMEQDATEAAAAASRRKSLQSSFLQGRDRSKSDVSDRSLHRQNSSAYQPRRRGTQAPTGDCKSASSTGGRPSGGNSPLERRFSAIPDISVSCSSSVSGAAVPSVVPAAAAAASSQSLAPAATAAKSSSGGGSPDDGNNLLSAPKRRSSKPASPDRPTPTFLVPDSDFPSAVVGAAVILAPSASASVVPLPPPPPLPSDSTASLSQSGRAAQSNSSSSSSSSTRLRSDSGGTSNYGPVATGVLAYLYAPTSSRGFAEQLRRQLAASGAQLHMLTVTKTAIFAVASWNVASQCSEPELKAVRFATTDIASDDAAMTMTMHQPQQASSSLMPPGIRGRGGVGARAHHAAALSHSGGGGAVGDIPLFGAALSAAAHQLRQQVDNNIDENHDDRSKLYPETQKLKHMLIAAVEQQRWLFSDTIFFPPIQSSSSLQQQQQHPQPSSAVAVHRHFNISPVDIVSASRGFMLDELFDPPSEIPKWMLPNIRQASSANEGSGSTVVFRVDGKETSDVKLSAVQQALLDAFLNAALGRLDVAGQLLNKVGQSDPAARRLGAVLRTM